MNIREELRIAINENNIDNRCYVNQDPSQGLIEYVSLNNLKNRLESGFFNKFDIPFIKSLLTKNEKVKKPHIDKNTGENKEVIMVKLVGRQIQRWCRINTGRSTPKDATQDGFQQE